MKTILITGHDTEIGKTWVTAAIARHLTHQQQTVQVVKPVETGLTAPNARQDVATVIAACGDQQQHITGHTLLSFPAPLAPVSAAKLAGETLRLDTLTAQLQALPHPAWRLIETAGGIAVPLDAAGADFRTLARQLTVDFVVLVIHNRLGAINQARLCATYTQELTSQRGFWFNDYHAAPADDVTQANYAELRSLGLPFWGHQKTHDLNLNPPPHFLPVS